jgi:hypothetical protein
VVDIQHVIIADYADIVNGKLYLMGGGWDTFYAKEAPSQVRLSIAVGVLVEWEETNLPLIVNLFVEDDDGKQMAKIEGKMQVGRPAALPPGSRQLSQMAANITMNLPTFGGYRIRVDAGTGDAAAERTVPFRMLERK